MRREAYKRRGAGTTKGTGLYPNRTSEAVRPRQSYPLAHSEQKRQPKFPDTILCIFSYHFITSPGDKREVPGL